MENKKKKRDLILFIVMLAILAVVFIPVAYQSYQNHKQKVYAEKWNSDDPIACMMFRISQRPEQEKEDSPLAYNEYGKLELVKTVMYIEGKVTYSGENNEPVVTFYPSKDRDGITTQDEIDAFNRMMKEDKIYKDMADYIIDTYDMSKECQEILKGNLTMDSLLEHPEDTYEVLNTLIDVINSEKEYREYKNYAIDEIMNRYL